MASRKNRNETGAIAILKATGHVVHRCIRTPGFHDGQWHNHSNDIFGSVDLIAKGTSLTADDRTRWIQVTAGKDIGRRVASFCNVPWKLAHDSVEIWRWVSGKGPRIDKRNGKERDRLYFQVYLLDDGFQLVKARRIRPAIGFGDIEKSRAAAQKFRV